MRPLLALSLSLFVCLLSNAQFKTIAQGPVFEEPETGFSKILQLKNGSTMFFHVTVKDGINLKIYDASRKQKAEKHIEPAYGKLKEASIDAIFEVNGDGVLLVSEIASNTPVLYRLVIDGKTGKLKEEKQVAELRKYNMGSGYAMAFGGVPTPDFYVRKDAYSENYAVAMLNSFESDRSRRIEIIFFGQDHKEISRAFYSSPDNKYKYLRYVDMTVIGKDKVSVLAYAYNTKSSGGKESELVLANLDAGAKSVTLHELNFSKDEVVRGGITRYNPVTKKIILLAAAQIGKSNKYSAILATVDPFQKSIDKARTIYPVHANEKSTELFGEKNGFQGMPQNMFINNDGSYSIVFEELTVIASSSSSAGFSFGSGRTSFTTELGNLAVLRFDNEGKEAGSYLIPKNHRLVATRLSSFYHSEREGSAQLLGYGNQFKSFAYLNGKDKTYILFNDIEKNEESVMKGKLTTIQGVGECDGFYYNIAGKETMPSRSYVFGKPESKKENNLGLFAISDYNSETNTYVTLKLEKEGRDKGVRIVWLQP